MKRTGPTSSHTRSLAVQMDKHAKSTKSGLYAVLTEALNGPTRTRAEVSVGHLNMLAEQHKDKIFVVPGKVLGTGDVTLPLQVAAFRCSESAKKKILSAKGKMMTLEELVSGKIPTKNMILVK